MADNAIEMRGVSKRYRLGGSPMSGSAREAFSQGLRRAWRRQPRLPDEAREVWALRDLDLDVPEGASVGIVGRNGAGKSTLLKILSRITEPTEGTSRIRGKVGSLLEVGTGFHPELSGRENIFLNGAVLGLSRKLVARRLDEIVAFSGVARFLDTPVKRYSSGMYLRLAFAVAAHVDADVLLVDEVLAVGDAEFQRRCLGAMEQMGRSGRTVVFVSHNLDAVVRLCSTALWLDAGRIRAVGPTSRVVDEYLRAATPDGGVRAFDCDPGSPLALTSLRIRGATTHSTGRLPLNEPVVVDITLAVREKVPGLDLGVSVDTLTGTRLLDEALSDTSGSGFTDALSTPGRYSASLTLPPLLMPGEYVVNVWAGTAYETLVWEEGAARLRLEGSHQARPDRLIHTQGRWAITAGSRDE
jgi:ABC-2 type transport system ATP-binding protein/lipopolysaccharide transport system ATP-binding protein